MIYVLSIKLKECGDNTVKMITHLKFRRASFCLRIGDRRDVLTLELGFVLEESQNRVQGYERIPRPSVGC